MNLIVLLLSGRPSRPLGVEDNRIGYIQGSIRGSIRYLPEYVAYEPPHPLWKPHGYFPPGEAPPPYEEAVAAARAEAALQNIPSGKFNTNCLRFKTHNIKSGCHEWRLHFGLICINTTLLRLNKEVLYNSLASSLVN